MSLDRPNKRVSRTQTGTLTEDGLDLQCVLPILHSVDSTDNLQSIEFGSAVTDVTDLNWRDEEAHSMIIVCMAGKHSMRQDERRTIELI